MKKKPRARVSAKSKKSVARLALREQQTPFDIVVGPEKKAEPGSAVLGIGRRSALGRGLSALMSAAPVSADRFNQAAEHSAPSARVESAAPLGNTLPREASEEILDGEVSAESRDRLEQHLLRYLAIDTVIAAKGQPRQSFPEQEIESLAQSIRDTGLLQPIVVRRLELQGGESTCYEIVAGERRWRAARKAGLARIPALVRQLNDREALELGIIENVQRADLNPIEEALAYQRLIEEFGESQGEVAETIGKDRVSVANSLRLLKLPEPVRQLLVDGRITAGHGRALLGLSSVEEQEALALRILHEGLSVRAAEQIAQGAKPLKQRQRKNPSSPVLAKTPAVLELEERLRRVLGTKVNLTLDREGKGELRISFFSSDELQSLLDRLGA